MGENGFNIIAPTVLDPFVDIALNRNYADRKLMPDQNPFEKVPTPDSQRAFPSTHPAYKKVAELVNSLTGGNQQKSGYVDISPESIQHLVETYTGAAGGFMNRTYTMLLGPEEMETWRKPFVRKFYGEKVKYSVGDSYRNNKTHIAYLEERSDYLREKARSSPDDEANYIKWRKDNADGLRLVPRLKSQEKLLRRLYKQRKPLMADPEKNKDRIKQIEEYIMETQTRFNKDYNDVLLDKGLAEEFNLIKN